MNTGNSNSATERLFSVRRLALVLLVLIAFRGATWGVVEYVSTGDWLAGVFGVVTGSVIAYWLYTLAVDSPSEG